MKRLKHIVRLYWHSRKAWHQSEFWKKTRFCCIAAVFANLFTAACEFFWWHHIILGIINLSMAILVWLFNWSSFMGQKMRERDEWEKKMEKLEKD